MKSRQRSQRSSEHPGIPDSASRPDPWAETDKLIRSELVQREEALQAYLQKFTPNGTDEKELRIQIQTLGETIECLGHASDADKAMLEHYSHIRMEAERTAVQALDRIKPSVGETSSTQEAKHVSIN